MNEGYQESESIVHVKVEEDFSIEQINAQQPDERNGDKDDFICLSADEDEDYERLEGVFRKKSKGGRKPDWPEEWADDLIDIILNDENLKQKLLLTNVKNVKNSQLFAQVVEELELRHVDFKYNVKQTRGKFRRCVNMCRNALLTQKTESGIKMFQEDKNLGAWFRRLIEVVRCMDGVQPQQGTEPPLSCNRTDTSPKATKRNLSSIHETVRKKSKISQGMDDLRETLKSLTAAIQNDTATRSLINFLKEDSDRQARRDEAFMSFLKSMMGQPPHESETIQPFQVPFMPQPTSNVHQKPFSPQSSPLIPNNTLPQPMQSHRVPYTPLQQHCSYSMCNMPAESSRNTSVELNNLRASNQTPQRQASPRSTPSSPSYDGL